jgi:DNA-binding transcriptional LysR family regulator
VVREGVDCVLRWDALPDSDLVARPVALLPRITCAAPSYVERYGTPRTIADLARHRTVGLRSITTGAVRPFVFQAADGPMRVAVAAPFSVTGTETFLAGVRLGLGLAQMPTFHVAQDLAAGRLLRLLPDLPVPPGPVSVLYPRNRQLSPRVRVFIDWIVQRFAAASGGGTAAAPPEV